MEQQLDFIKCYYRPSFFHMKIDLPVDLGDLNEITDATFALYLHEYIHFVQDISTIYGLMNISTINYYIQYCAHKIYNEKKKEFEVPIKLVEKPNVKDYGVSNFNLRPIYIGSSPAVFMAINQILKVFYKDTPSSCELISYCKQSQKQDPKLTVDDNCHKSPWLKATEKDLCPFGQTWHHWALKEYAPKYK